MSQLLLIVDTPDGSVDVTRYDMVDLSEAISAFLEAVDNSLGVELQWHP